MDVVVHHRHVEGVDQSPLDLEAVRGADVLEVDRAEPRRDAQHGGDELLDVLGVDQDREGGDPGHLAVEERLALHHRHRCDRADVPEAEHPGAVGADGYRTPDHREPVGEGRIVGDRGADPSDPGRIDVANVLEGVDRVDDLDRELAADVGLESTVVEREHAHSL
jgi:hypothetical protein